jgi:signal transduction histidine kinase
MWNNRAKIVLFLLVFCIPYFSNAKILNSSLESTKFQLQEFILKKDTNKIYSSLKFMNNHFENFNTQDNLELLLRVSKKENKLSLSSLKELFLLIRRYYSAEGQHSENFKYTLKAYNVLIKTKDHEGTMWILIDLGNVFYEELDYQQAFKFYKRAENSARLAKSNYGLGVVTMNLGLIKERLFSFEQALGYYSASAYYRTISGQINTLSLIYVKIAYCNLKLGKPDICLNYIHRAETNYKQAKVLGNEAIEAPYSINYVYAEYFASKKKYDSSLIYIQKGIDYATEKQMIYEELMGNNFKSEYYFQNGQYREAIKSLNHFLPFFKKNKILKFERHVYDIFHKCYSALNDEKNATLYAQKYVLIDDSLKRYDSNDNLEMMRSIVSVYETNFKINSTQKNLQFEKVKNAMRQNERNKYWYIAIISVFCVFLLFGLFLNTQKNKLKMVDLHNRLIEQNNKIKFNSIELNKSNQLKDNLFFVISNDLSEPLNRLKSDLVNLKDSLGDKKIAENIESTLNETIHLFEGLLDWSKTDQNQNIFNPTKVSLDININKVISFYLNDIQSMDIKVINKSVALSTFADQNILQTLLRNIISNSIAALRKCDFPKVIEIETFVHNHYLIELLISDSGPGFPVEILHQFNQMEYEINAKRSGLGLSICKVLSKMSGWKIEIANDSKHGGASISIFIPIYNQVEASEAAKELLVSEKVKTTFLPLHEFKVYQTSEIRTFLKTVEHLDDVPTKDWIVAIENAVREGDQKYFSDLLDKLKV